MAGAPILPILLSNSLPDFPLPLSEFLESKQKHCRVCTQMQQRKPHWKQEGPSLTCLLCSHPYCEEHKGTEKGVCEINHRTYWRNHYLPNTYPSLSDRERKLGKGKAEMVAKDEVLHVENRALGEGGVSRNMYCGFVNVR